MTIRINENGYLVISAVVSGYRVQRTYAGYSREEAVELFTAETGVEI